MHEDKLFKPSLWLLDTDMEKLEVLDLEGNKVDDLGGLMYLSWCPQLAVLTLADNPVALDPSYHTQVWLCTCNTLLRVVQGVYQCLHTCSSLCCICQAVFI